ncbi:NUDIX hydrolase [Streptococcus halichoeri]|uniref:NUDIX hydrolase n=1 Tax=Streptococcus halichoeri TaxID=254785 RepID=UPI00135941DB|nr:NUDIX domain-containing protein [Streptococcus halichoeri]
MKQDFRTTQGKTTFSLRASALIVRDDKIFLTRDVTGKYYTIGGASLVGEKTRETVLRETLEEINIPVEVGQLAFIVENRFYINDVFWHNIEFHYFVRPLEEPKLKMMENATQQVCEWIPINRLDQIKLVPEFLQTELAKWSGHIVHIED